MQDAIAIALLIVKGALKDSSIHELVNNKESSLKSRLARAKITVSDWQVVYSTARIISTFISLSAFQNMSHFIHCHPDFVSTIGFFMNPLNHDRALRPVIVKVRAGLFEAGLRKPRVSANFKLRYESLKSQFS